MNFDLTEEQRMLQEMLGQLLSDHCSVNDVHKLLEAESETDPAPWKRLGEIGIPGLAIPEAY
ncbi:MAG: acyl-CoA dehydrogenase family protein, partial [bacterium]